jgi:hypothetical protein
VVLYHFVLTLMPPKAVMPGAKPTVWTTKFPSDKLPRGEQKAGNLCRVRPHRVV